jgi:hypothetical protein
MDVKVNYKIKGVHRQKGLKNPFVRDSVPNNSDFFKV